MFHLSDLVILIIYYLLFLISSNNKILKTFSIPIENKVKHEKWGNLR